MVDVWDGPTPAMMVSEIGDDERHPPRWCRFELNDAAAAEWEPPTPGQTHRWPSADETLKRLLTVGTRIQWWHNGETLGWAEITVNDNTGLEAAPADPPLKTKQVPFNQLTILPPADPQSCQQCAIRHPPNQPHDAASLHYQYTIYQHTGRWPSWADAAAHCTPQTQTTWRTLLEQKGVAWEDPAKIYGPHPEPHQPPTPEV